MLNSTLNMTYENLLQQVNLAEQWTSSDFGVSTGLISQGYWESSKWYFVNVERGTFASKRDLLQCQKRPIEYTQRINVERGNIADKLQPRNINVSFNNNSNVAIDALILTFYSDQIVIDVETGIVTKYFFLNIVMKT